MSSTVVVITNVPDDSVAAGIADALIAERAAACVNILARCVSVYRWNGAVERGDEVPMLIKTTAACYPAVEAIIRRLHPYTVPEIIALPVVAGLPDYLAWVAAETERPVST